ncbi:TRAP transporter substrate-binding protein [Achromobacter mucicolens]|uniref:TRAP transporter substrate-binding protein n=1 Tax=Achromobacter mucicolens TaxID=1389922 RepID=A0ABD4Z451_9BURK|nr:TRAP transporter substrate-binding protein [Achromobacter mucicolens]MDH1182134.1 TRAP transporter substrate-binding protein [Achromobacter mucicolens]
MKTKLLSKLLLSACLAAPMAMTAHAAEETYEMRVGNITSNDAQERSGQIFIDLVEKKSGGKIKGKLYSGGSLGSNDEVMRGLRLGSIQGNINPSGNLSQFVAQAGVLTLPWLFPGKNAEEQIENITNIMEGQAGDKIKELADERGFHVVSLFGLGPNQIYLREYDKSKSVMENLQDKRIRTIGGQEHTQTVNDWGARAIHMSLPEVYTSIQQGVLDGFDLPAAVTVRLKYHEQAPNVLLTNHIVLTQYIAVSKAWYDSLPDDLKKAVDEAGKETEALGTQEYVDEQNEALNLLASNDKFTVIELTDADRAALQKLNKEGVWAEVAKNPAKAEMLKLLEEDIKKLAK